MDGIVFQFAKLKEVFLFTNGKVSWMLKGAVSLETVVLSIQDKMLKWMFFRVSQVLYTLFNQCDT